MSLIVNRKLRSPYSKSVIHRKFSLASSIDSTIWSVRVNLFTLFYFAITKSGKFHYFSTVLNITPTSYFITIIIQNTEKLINC